MLIAGNWKMFKGPHEARVFAAQIRNLSAKAGDVDVVVCPPAVSLAATVQGLGAESGVRVYAQNVHWELEGAFTGEISAPMALEAGATGTLVGHSERRQHFGETDDTVRMRAETALEQGLSVIACVGETEAEREAGQTEDVLGRQVAGCHGTSGSSSRTSPCGRSAPGRPPPPRPRRRRTRSSSPCIRRTSSTEAR